MTVGSILTDTRGFFFSRHRLQKWQMPLSFVPECKIAPPPHTGTHGLIWTSVYQLVEFNTMRNKLALEDPDNSPDAVQLSFHSGTFPQTKQILFSIFTSPLLKK